VAYIDDILTAIKESLANHYRQVSKVFQQLVDKNRCIEIDKGVFDATEITFLWFCFSGSELQMDLDKAKAKVDWPRFKTRTEVQQLEVLCNFSRRFIHNVLGIMSPITDLLRQETELNRGEAQEAAFLKITIVFTSGTTPILIHQDPD
jgi:hypothetical protein